MLLFAEVHNKNTENYGNFCFCGDFEERKPENERKKGGKIFILRLFLFIVLKMWLLFLRKFYVLTMKKTLQSGLQYGIIIRSDMRRSERLPPRRGTFVEYVRSIGRNRQSPTCKFLFPCTVFPETTRADADAWANPVFVGERKKRMAGCHDGSRPNEKAPRQNGYIYYIRAVRERKIQKGGKNNGSQGENQSQTDEL